jgi:hypothetical protein
VTKGDDSVAAYQKWLERPDAPFAQAHPAACHRHPQEGHSAATQGKEPASASIAAEAAGGHSLGVRTVGSLQLEALRAYNQDDTDSTLLAVLWLRRAASRALGPRTRGSKAALEVAAVQSEAAALELEAAQGAARLADEARLDWLAATLRDDQDPRWQGASRLAREVAAASLGFEQREARPIWWRRFAWLEATNAELLSDPDAFVRAMSTNNIREAESKPPAMCFSILCIYF